MASSSSTGNATEHALDAVARDRADESTENLVRILFRFLGFTFFSILGSQNCSVTEDDCNNIVQETTSKDEQLGYNMLQLLEHKRLWDVVTRDKEGNDKKHFFCDQCRRVASHFKNSGTATERAAAEREEAEKSACYRSLAEDMFASELTEEQQRNPKYKLQKDKWPTNNQRS